MRLSILVAALVALAPSFSLAQTPTPAPSPTLVPVPLPVPAPRGAFRLIKAPNTDNNTRAMLKCKPFEIIMSAVCNNHKAPTAGSTQGPGVPATYINQTTAECRGASFNDSAVAICADYGQAQPSQ